jgi:hypothetical protein
MEPPEMTERTERTERTEKTERIRKGGEYVDLSAFSVLSVNSG